jgi:hypothetical protein
MRRILLRRGLFAYLISLFSLSLLGRTSLLRKQVDADDGGDTSSFGDDIIGLAPSSTTSEAPVAVKDDLELGLESSIFDDEDNHESTRISSLSNGEAAMESSCSSSMTGPKKSPRQENETCSPPRLSQDEEIDILRGPLDPVEARILLGPLGSSVETENDNFILSTCPVAVVGGPSIPVCSSSRTEDITIDYEGFRTLENCELCGFPCLLS